MDATFDTQELIPEEVAKSKRYKQFSGYSIQEVVDAVKKDVGTIDYMVHSLANGPEVTKALLDTSRAGYLAASSASAYSLVSMVSRFAPIMVCVLRLLLFSVREYFVETDSSSSSSSASSIPETLSTHPLTNLSFLCSRRTPEVLLCHLHTLPVKK